jgi:hypothetical protein
VIVRRCGRRALRSFVVFACAFTLAAGAAGAQPQNVADSSAASRENATIIATLVRTTLVALDQANVTGNYTVFRELAAPSFRERNSDASLAVIFASLRQANIDLSAVVVLEPQLTAPPSLDNNHALHIEGTLATKPAPVRFELLFQAIEGRWRLFGVSVNPIAAAKPAAPPLAGGGAAPILPGSLVPPVPRPRPTP